MDNDNQGPRKRHRIENNSIQNGEENTATNVNSVDNSYEEYIEQEVERRVQKRYKELDCEFRQWKEKEEEEIRRIKDRLERERKEVDLQQRTNTQVHKLQEGQIKLDIGGIICLY
jgi:hypothetical protein